MVWEILHDKRRGRSRAQAADDVPRAARSWKGDTGATERRASSAWQCGISWRKSAPTPPCSLPRRWCRTCPGSPSLCTTGKLQEFAEHRRESDPNDLRNDNDPPPVVPEIPRYPPLHEDAAPRWAALSAKARADDTDLIVPPRQRARYEAAFSRFASVFPDTFYVTERGRYFPDDSDRQWPPAERRLSQYDGLLPRRLRVLQLILDDKGKKELNRLWNEFDFIADHTARTWTQYYFNQSGEVDGKGDRVRLQAPDRSRGDRPGRDLQDARQVSGQGRGKPEQRSRRAPRPSAGTSTGSTRPCATWKRSGPQPSRSIWKLCVNFAASAPTAGRSRRPSATDLLAYYHQLRAQNQLSRTKTPCATRSSAC